MSKLKISDDLSLPLDFTTQTQAILAKVLTYLTHHNDLQQFSGNLI